MEIKTVIVIRDGYGDLVAIARDYKSAIDFLINEEFLEENEVVYDGVDWKLPHEYFGKNWKKKIYALKIEEFNRLFEYNIDTEILR